jgi:hypothetical protein
LILINLTKKLILQKKILLNILKKTKVLININNLVFATTFNAQNNTIFNNSSLNIQFIYKNNFTNELAYNSKKKLINKLNNFNRFFRFNFNRIKNYLSIIALPLEIFKLLFERLNLHSDFLTFLKNNKFNEELKMFCSLINKKINVKILALIFFNFFFFKKNLLILKNLKFFNSSLIYPKLEKLNLIDLAHNLETKTLLFKLIKNNKQKNSTKSIDKKIIKTFLKTNYFLQKIKAELLSENLKLNNNLNKLNIFFKSEILINKYKKLNNLRNIDFYFYNESKINFDKNLINFFKITNNLIN